MRNIKRIFKNITSNILFLLVVLIILLIFLSIFEIIGLASIPVLLSSIIISDSGNLIQINIFNLTDLISSFSQEDQIKLISVFIILLFTIKNINLI